MPKPSKQNKQDEARQRADARRVRDLAHKAQLTSLALADARARLADGQPSAKDGHPADTLKRYADKATAVKVFQALSVGQAVDPRHPTEAELKTVETQLGVSPVVEAERKDWDWDDDFGYYEPWRPYGGATSIADAIAAMDAQEQAAAIQQAAWIFQDITSNILNDPTLTDKASAIAAAAGELQALLNDPSPLMKDAEPMPAAADEAEAKTPAPAMSADMLNPQPLTQPGTFQVFKGLDGQFYALGRVTNKWRDRDYAKHPQGEIITDAAHKEFADFLNAHPDQAPELWTWHTPGTARKSRAIWWDYADGFFHELWPLTEDEAKQFNPDETLGMSHGFFVLERDAKQGLITKYRSFEGSELPPEWTANPWTSLETLKEAKAMSFNTDQRDFLVKRFGEKRVAELEADTAQLAKALDTLGIESKSAAAAGAGSGAAAAAPAGPEAEAAFETLKTLLDVDGLNKVITELQTKNQALEDQAALVPELQKQLAAIDATVKQLTKSDDEKMAEQIAPKIKPIIWGFQASADEKSKLTPAEQEKFKDQKPTTSGSKGTGWVADAIGAMAPAA